MNVAHRQAAGVTLQEAATVDPLAAATGVTSGGARRKTGVTTAAAPHQRLPSRLDQRCAQLLLRLRRSLLSIGRRSARCCSVFFPSWVGITSLRSTHDGVRSLEMRSRCTPGWMQPCESYVT